MDCFKAYDIRGIYPYEVNEEFAFKFGRAVGKFLKAKKLVVCRDGRSSSNDLFRSLVDGMSSVGCDVINIGRNSTPQFYFEVFSGTSDGGVMITASHNPKEYNGFKVCGIDAKPIYLENGLLDIKKLMTEDDNLKSNVLGHVVNKQISDEYVKFFSQFAVKLNKKLKIIFDTGNGMGITEVKALKRIYGSMLDETVMYSIIDGEFPNHECDPSKLKNTEKLQMELARDGYDLGFALDGDADRVVCFTKSGMKIPSDVLTAILAVKTAKKGDKVGFEVRTSQSVVEFLEKEGFVGRLYPSGHSLIKMNMIKDNCVFAGEKSGHYFYQSLHYVESTLLTIMKVIEFYLERDIEVVAKEIMSKRISLEEKNYTVTDKNKVLELIEKEFSDDKIVKVDGLSVYGLNYFFNIRKSNTENVIRLNIEGLNNKIVSEILERIESIIAKF
ncbi:MAG: phosphomannomutase/phosphoglucomutase [Candidatus Woesearchaeota archaeon]